MMNQGTEPHELPIGVVLSERNKEILLAARSLEEVLNRHNMTFAGFALTESILGGGNPTVDLMVCQMQMSQDKDAELAAALEKLSESEKEILSKHFKEQ